MEREGDFPPPVRLVVTIPSSSGQSDHNRGFPPAIELTDIISPSSNGFTRNPLDSIGNSSAQSPSSITLSASSPSRVALLPPAEDTVIDIPRHGNLPAHIPGTTPDELVEILNFIKHQQFGERPTLTNRQMLAAFLMIGLFSYTPAAMSNLLTAGLLPNADDYWANFDQSAIDKYTRMIIAVSWNSLAWAIPTIVLSAGQAGAHLGESLSYNRASIEKNLRGRQAGRFLSLLVAAGSAAVPVSIFYSGIQGDYQSGLVTNPDEYNRRMYTQLGLIGLFTIVQNYPSFSQLTERTFNFFGKGATPEVQTSRQNLVELFQKAAHHAYQLDDEATANAYTTFTAAADPLSQLNFLAFLGEADGDAASHTSAISCGDKVLYGIAGTLGVCNATMRS